MKIYHNLSCRSLDYLNKTQIVRNSYLRSIETIRQVHTRMAAGGEGMFIARGMNSAYTLIACA